MASGGGGGRRGGEGVFGGRRRSIDVYSTRTTPALFFLGCRWRLMTGIIRSAAAVASAYHGEGGEILAQ